MVFFDFLFFYLGRVGFIEKSYIFAIRIFEKKSIKFIDHEKNVSTISKKEKKQARFQKPYGY